LGSAQHFKKLLLPADILFGRFAAARECAVASRWLFVEGLASLVDEELK